MGNFAEHLPLAKNARSQFVLPHCPIRRIVARVRRLAYALKMFSALVGNCGFALGYACGSSLRVYGQQL